MKILFGTLLACLALTQSLQAIPSNLGESLREYQTILDNSAALAQVIPENEFIFEIQRKTKNIDATIIKYEVETHSFSKHNHFKAHEYLVILQQSPNPQVGPPILTFVSITPIKDD